jgi:hypothetical protein
MPYALSVCLQKGVSSTSSRSCSGRHCFDAVPRYSLCFFASLGFSSAAMVPSPAPDIVSMIQSQIGEIAITFPSTLPPAFVFRFGVTRRHGALNPRILANWWPSIISSSTNQCSLDNKKGR